MSSVPSVAILLQSYFPGYRGLCVLLRSFAANFVAVVAISGTVRRALASGKNIAAFDPFVSVDLRDNAIKAAISKLQPGER